MSQLEPDASRRFNRAAQQTHSYPRVSRFTTAGLIGLTLLTGGWAVEHIMFPIPPVQAYTGRLDLVIDMRPGDTYDSLIRRAESAARAAAQRNFDRDILISDVNITVVVQRNQAVVPVLSLQVSRADWQTFPDPQKWATYFTGTRTLLGFKN